MPTDARLTREISARLVEASQRTLAAYPGEPADRQPIHTVYGGAHLFRADVATRMGAAALRGLAAYAPDAGTFARVLGLTDLPSGPTHELYDRVIRKLEHEPVEDYRIDFEDGYGARTDAEEDGHAVAAATEMARGLAAGSLPPFVGIRVKPLTAALHLRAMRTLDLFVPTLLGNGAGALPPHFAVTLPKVTSPAQVTALATLLEQLERANGLPALSLKIELMVELPQTLFGPRGEPMLPALVAAAGGRCRSAHFGAYDYLAGLGLTVAHQQPGHPACDFARHVMQACLAGTGITISDGANTVIPVGPHRESPGSPPLTGEQRQENQRAVHRGWRMHFDEARRSLRAGFHQGWDLNPAQLPPRFAAVFAFFMESRDEASARLRSFIGGAARATLLGSTVDDAATGQGLLNFFLRGIACGALGEQDALAAGLTLEQLRGRSLAKIPAGRGPR